jgi:2'-5' RNA ligase
MMLPKDIRVFFAIALSTEFKEQLGVFILNLQEKAKTRAIRWTKQENLHITLQFLPELQSNDLPLLVENVHKTIKNTPPLTFSIGSIQLFPNPYHPRVIVLDIMPQDDLVALAKKIARGIKASHYPTEDRLFRAHVTLGRIKHPHDVKLNFLAESVVPKLEKISASEVILFRSQPQVEGSVYTPLYRIELRDHASSKLKI